MSNSIYFWTDHVYVNCNTFALWFGNVLKRKRSISIYHVSPNKRMKDWLYFYVWDCINKYAIVGLLQLKITNCFFFIFNVFFLHFLTKWQTSRLILKAEQQYFTSHLKSNNYCYSRYTSHSQISWAPKEVLLFSLKHAST